MSEAILSIRAECRTCGWLGMGSERTTKYRQTDALWCPKCSGATRSWVVDQAKEMADLDRIRGERLDALMQSNQHARQARLAGERWRDAKRRTEFARHTVALLDQDHPKYLEAQQAMIAAQREEAEAALARDQAKARVHVQERG